MYFFNSVRAQNQQGLVEPETNLLREHSSTQYEYNIPPWGYLNESLCCVTLRTEEGKAYDLSYSIRYNTNYSNYSISNCGKYETIS